METDTFQPFTLRRQFGTLTSVRVVPLSAHELTPRTCFSDSTALAHSELDRGPRDFSPKIPYPYLYRTSDLLRDLTAANFDRNLLLPGSIGISLLFPDQANACTQNRFWPPRGFTPASPCRGIDRSASSRTPVTPGAFTPRPLQAAGLSVSLRMPL